MHYVQFYNPSATNPQLLVEAVGDRSVVILDGRCSWSTHHAIAMDEMDKRGFSAYRLMQGETFTRSTPRTGVLMSIEALKAGCRAD